MGAKLFICDWLQGLSTICSLEMMKSCWCRSGGRARRQRQGRADGALQARLAGGAEAAGTSGEEGEAGGERAARRSKRWYSHSSTVTGGGQSPQSMSDIFTLLLY